MSWRLTLFPSVRGDDNWHRLSKDPIGIFDLKFQANPNYPDAALTPNEQAFHSGFERGL